MSTVMIEQPIDCTLINSNIQSLFSTVVDLANKIHQNRWGDTILDKDDSYLRDDTPAYSENDYSSYESIEDCDEEIQYKTKMKNFIKNSPIKFIEAYETVYDVDDVMGQAREALEAYYNRDNDETDKCSNEKKKDDGKVYINPFVPAKEQSKRDKTKYIEEHNDIIFEYDWNILSYDNYNTPDQDPLTYDYDFNLNNYEGVRGVFLDLGDEDDYLIAGETYHTSYELVTMKFLPKAYRYAKGIAYTEAEQTLLMSFESTSQLLGLLPRVNQLTVDEIVDENPSINYVQSHLKKYRGYLEFCEHFNLAPEWRDVHRHYGVWFSKPIITFQIWEEWYDEDEEFKDVLLESILSGTYFEAKRREVEEVMSRLTEEDKVIRAYHRHRDIYPDDDIIYGRYVEEDDAYEGVSGYDPDDGAVLRHEFYLDEILDATSEYLSTKNIDYDKICTYQDICDHFLAEEDKLEEYKTQIHDIEREAEESIPEIKLEEKLAFYKEKEREKLKKEYDIEKYKDTNPFYYSFLLMQIMGEADKIVEVETRPILEMVCEKKYRPSVEQETLNFNTMYKSLFDCTSFEQMLQWRGSKFDCRAGDILKALHEQVTDTFYRDMIANSYLNPDLDPKKKAEIDELWDNLDDDELPPIEFNENEIEFNMTKLGEFMKIAATSDEDLGLIRLGTEKLSSQYSRGEKAALGLDDEDNSFNHDSADREAFEVLQQMKQAKEMEEAGIDPAYLN